ncbi:putative nuclease HARBI1 [Nymphon striatum]|nr:putative nuclease HARBI1 [Nymphon striatum]
MDIDKWGFPNYGGAIDGSHIPIISPKEYHVDYYNRKGSYSIILQAICNDRCEFTDINVGWPGRVYDAKYHKEKDPDSKKHILQNECHLQRPASQIVNEIKGCPMLCDRKVAVWSRNMDIK